MASIYGSGGKILRPRLTATDKTPYDRPGTSNSASRSANWLSRFVLSPTRFIASGTGKLISSVLDLESSPSPSSSFASSSSYSSGSDSEEVGTVNNENDIPFEGGDVLTKSETFEVINFPTKELQPIVWNSKNKHVIEQLLMQETFSGEDCERLINIIRSRVVDSPANEDNADERPRDIPNRSLGDSPDLCSIAVIEAKKWLQEKNSGLDSSLGCERRSLNLVTLSQGFKDGGSPVDVAKSYMHACPPWASPSIDHIKPLSSIESQLFKEKTPYLIGGNSSLSSKLKRDPPVSGSWSIQDEIRRVRSRATEEMLKTLPYSKIDWSALSMEYKNNVSSSAIENIEARLGEKAHSFTNSVDSSSNLARGLSTQASPDLERNQERFLPEAVLSDPANDSSEKNQGFGVVQQTEGSQDDSKEMTTSGPDHELSDDMMTIMQRDCLVKVNGTNYINGGNHQLSLAEETKDASNSGLVDGNCPIFKEKVRAEGALAIGFPSSGASFYVGQVQQNRETSNEDQCSVDSVEKRTAEGALEQDTCKEPYMELPDVTANDTLAINEDDSIATGSQTSSSAQHVVQHDYSQPGSESDLVAMSSRLAKQKGRRVTKYSRRGRGRGVK